MCYDRRCRAGFTLVELLVVIGVIAVLTGLLMPVINRARWNAKVAACQSNLRNLLFAVEMYKTNNDGRYPPWLTYLGDPRRDPAHPEYDEDLAEIAPDLITDAGVFICPADDTAGEEGNRNSAWGWGGVSGGGDPFDEFQNPDVDWHGDWDFTKDNTSEDKVRCSYLYEFSGEICEWAHENLDGGAVPCAGVGEPASELVWLKRVGPDDWEETDWMTGGIPAVDDFKKVADTNHDGKVSWGEMKMMNVMGRSVTSGGAQYKLPSMEGRLPLIRCYWHVGGPAVDDNSANVLNVNVGGHVSKGYFYWQRDLGGPAPK